VAALRLRKAEHLQQRLDTLVRGQRGETIPILKGGLLAGEMAGG
jgi:hypothetical protein